MEHVYLSRRNLLSLLNKLDRNKNSGKQESYCTIIKNDKVHPKYPQTMDSISITAIEDEEYYCDRNAGKIFEADDPNIKL